MRGDSRIDGLRIRGRGRVDGMVLSHEHGARKRFSSVEEVGQTGRQGKRREEMLSLCANGNVILWDFVKNRRICFQG